MLWTLKVEPNPRIENLKKKFSRYPADANTLIVFDYKSNSAFSNMIWRIQNLPKYLLFLATNLNWISQREDPVFVSSENELFVLTKEGFVPDKRGDIA